MGGGVRQKSELKLGEHVRKALSPAETAPKQKHVRACIMFAWDFQSSEPFWTAVGMHPMLSDAVVCYKGLAAIHKVLVGGPHVVLSEALAHRPFLDSCMRAHGQSAFGYGPLIGAYVPLLLGKLEFHRLHPSFTGNFDYEEYVSVRGVANLDEGYETVGNLLSVLDRLDRFQRVVFAAGALSECRIAPFVPLIEESHGIYRFVTSMLEALVRQVTEPEALLPLVERYRTHLRALRAFYSECRRIHWLTSLVEVPQLPAEPAAVAAIVEEPETRVVVAAPPRVPTPPLPAAVVVREPTPPQGVLVDLLGDIVEEGAVVAASTTGMVTESARREEVATHMHTVTTVPVHDARLVAEVEALRAHAAAMDAELGALRGAYGEAQRALEAYATQDAAQQADAEEMRRRLSAAEIRLLHAADPAEAEARVADVRAAADAAVAEAARWKTKFEGIAVLYQGLRGEHLAVLERVRVLEERAGRGEASPPQSASPRSPDRLGDEMARVAAAVEDAARRLEEMRAAQAGEGASVLDRAVHAAVVDGAAEIATAVGALVRAAMRAQRAVVAAGRASGLSAEEFYLQHSSWTEGLVSAARAVGAATAMLVDVADGALRGTHGLHHVVAASHALSAATAQLVAASRVKAADLDAADLPGLETAARGVTGASQRLVESASAVMDAAEPSASDAVALPSGDAFAMRVEELEMQARVLALEREVTVARGNLAALRRAAYDSSRVEGAAAAATADAVPAAASDVSRPAGAASAPQPSAAEQAAAVTKGADANPWAAPDTADLADVFASCTSGAADTAGAAPGEANGADGLPEDGVAAVGGEMDLLGLGQPQASSAADLKTAAADDARAPSPAAAEPCPNEPSAQQ